MAKVDLGYDFSIDLEAGEEIIFKCINDPKKLFGYEDGKGAIDLVALYEKGDTLKDTIISKLSFGFAGPKLQFHTNMVITNKRIELIPYPNQKRTKDVMYTTQSLYFNKDIIGAVAAHTQNDTMYAECINAWFSLKQAKGVDLKGLYLMLQLKLSQEELNAVSRSMQKQMENKKTIKRVEELASQIEYDDFFDAFTTQVRVEMWKSKVKKMNKISVLGDKSVLPIRDFMIWTINNAVDEAK